MTASEKIYRFELDEVTEKEKQFYELYKDTKNLTCEHCRVITDEESLKVADSYKKLTSMIKEQQRLRDILIEKANGQNCIIGSLMIEKKKRKGAVDYAAIPELVLVDLEKYRKPEIEYYQIG